jgi:hypothetical protein
MPRDRGKPRHSTRNKNSFTRDNRLTTSQRALIAHFSQPHRPSSKAQSTLLIPKEENLPTLPQTQASASPTHPQTPSSTKLSPQPSQLASALPNTVKEEALPSPQYSGTKVEEIEPPPQLGPSCGSQPLHLPRLSASLVRRGLHCGGGDPPSWQLSKEGEDTGEAGAEEDNGGAEDTGEAGADKGNDSAENTGKIAEEGNDGADDGSHHTFHLAAEHLELLFDIRTAAGRAGVLPKNHPSAFRSTV